MKNTGFRVFYGFCKLNKVRKRQAISIIYENSSLVADSRSGLTLKKLQNNVCWRWQSDGEVSDASASNRVFTEYLIFIDECNGSLDVALDRNYKADANNVPVAELNKIKDSLRSWFYVHNRDYVEPTRQLSFDF